jgi:hypothetical protein
MVGINEVVKGKRTKEGIERKKVRGGDNEVRKEEEDYAKKVEEEYARSYKYQQWKREK